MIKEDRAMIKRFFGVLAGGLLISLILLAIFHKTEEGVEKVYPEYKALQQEALILKEASDSRVRWVQTPEGYWIGIFKPDWIEGKLPDGSLKN